MPKRAASFELSLPPRDPAVPAYHWLRTALRDEILEGRLKPGARLPATRDLARQYALSRGTIVSAFDQLRSEGYVTGATGSGTYVTDVLPDDVLNVAHMARVSPAPGRAGKRHLSVYGQRVARFPALEYRPTRAFRANQPALDLFPATLWAQVAGRQWRRASPTTLAGCGPMGHEPLRDAVADYLRASRGVNCTPAQVAIVSGVQEALNLAAQLLVDRGDVVCMENPGYPGASLVFEALGAKVRGVRLDDAGMKVPDERAHAARMAYVTPAHQFPTGISMSLPRRLELLEWARRTGAVIFEDDYDSEYRYAGRPLPALQGLDRHDVVIFAGSFSKVLFPSMRLGYLVVPEFLVERVADVKSVTNRHAPLMDQVVLAEFIADGHFGRHVRRMREVYAERLGALLEGARAELAGALEISSVEAGLQTAGWLARGLDADAIACAAAERDVEVTALGRYTRGRVSREGLMLGFAAVDVPEIRRGVRELAAVIERSAREHASRG